MKNLSNSSTTCVCESDHHNHHHHIRRISKRDRLIMAILTLILAYLFSYKIVVHALFLSAINYYDVRLLDEAERQLKKAIRIDKQFDDGYLFLGKIYQDVGKEKKAIEHYKKALRINKKNIEAYNDLGYIYFSKRDFKGVINNLQPLLIQNIKLTDEYQHGIYINAMRMLATAFEQENKKQQAIVTWKKILKVAPNDGLAKWRLLRLK